MRINTGFILLCLSVMLLSIASVGDYFKLKAAQQRIEACEAELQRLQAKQKEAWLILGLMNQR